MARSISLEGLLTSSGQPNAVYRQRWAILSNGRFPVAPGDKVRGRSAIRLRGNGTNKRERRRILNMVARRVPSLKEMIRIARENDKERGLI